MGKISVEVANDFQTATITSDGLEVLRFSRRDLYIFQRQLGVALNAMAWGLADYGFVEGFGGLKAHIAVKVNNMEEAPALCGRKPDNILQKWRSTRPIEQGAALSGTGVCERCLKIYRKREEARG